MKHFFWIVLLNILVISVCQGQSTFYRDTTFQQLHSKRTHVKVLGYFTVDSLFRLPKDTLSLAPDGSLAWKGGIVYQKDTTWKVMAGASTGSGGFFNDETNDGGASNKFGNGQSFHFTDVDTLTLGFNTLIFSNLTSGGVDENSEFVIRSSVDGNVYTAPVSSILFGAGDNLFSTDRSVDLNGNVFRFVGDEGDWASQYYFKPANTFFQHSNADKFTTLRIEPYDIFLGTNDDTSSSGLYIFGLDPSYVNVGIEASGYLLFKSDSVQFQGITDVTDTTTWKPFVMNSAGWVKRLDHWPGGGVGPFFYESNGALSSDRTVDGDGSFLRFIDVSEFGVRSSTSGSLDRILVDGSGSSIRSAEGNAIIGASDGRIDLDATDVVVPILAGVGSRHVGVDADGKLIIVSSGSGGSGGISQVIAGPGLESSNDSTLQIDSAYIVGLINPNLIVQNKGTLGKRTWSTSGDTLYMHTLNEGYGIDITKGTDSTNVFSVDSTQFSTKANVLHQISISSGGSAAVTDSIQVVSVYSDMTGNIAMDTVRKRIVYRIANTFRYVAYTDSAFQLTPLSTPGSFAASPNSDTQIDLTWSDVSNETGYQIYRNTVNTYGTATLINSPAANATSYSSTGLTASTLYYYWILAVGNGIAYSNSSTATTSATTNVGLDTDASAYITRVEAALGSSLSSGQKTAINTYVLGLKTDGIWSKIYDQWLFIGGTAAAHAESLKGAAPDVTWVNSPTHSANGVVGNGSTQYGNLNVSPTTVGTQNDLHIGVHVRNDVGSASQTAMGCVSTSPTRATTLLPRTAGTTGSYIVNSGTANSTAFVATGAGLSVINRTTSTHQDFYKNGSLLVSSATASTGLGTANFYLMAYNNNGASVLNYSTHQIDFATAGVGLSAGDNTNLSSRVTALQTALGR